MKEIISLIVLAFAPFILNGQDLEKKMMLIQKENDSLRIELEKCLTSPLQRITQNISNSGFSDTPIYSEEELSVKLLAKIKVKSKSKYKLAVKVINDTDIFEKYCIGLANELIEKSGGIDSITQRPRGYKDKTVVNNFFIEEKKGIELKAKITDLRSKYLSFLKKDAFLEKKITLDIDESLALKSGRTWEVQKFYNMPLAAILPTLTKYIRDAHQSKFIVLQYFNE